jgi:hypothetical protein
VLEEKLAVDGQLSIFRPQAGTSGPQGPLEGYLIDRRLLLLPSAQAVLAEPDNAAEHAG